MARAESRASPPDSPRAFAGLLGMDAVARTGYQAGKSPVLPLFAATVGAGPELVGVAVAVSTCTGVVGKPWFGALSDRIGRRPLLWGGTLVFALVPLAYLAVDSVGALIGVRAAHGLATAIYGPVMAAMVADLFVQRRRGVRAFGWYDCFRSLGYVLGPLVGAFALARMGDPRGVYLVVGAFGLVAFLPALLLPAPATRSVPAPPKRRLLEAPAELIRRSPLTRRVLVLDFLAHSLSRMCRTFWPLAAIPFLPLEWIGLIVSAHFAAAMLVKPIVGPLSQRWGSANTLALSAGSASIAAVALFGATALGTGPALPLIAVVVMGLGEGLGSPVGLALVAYESPTESRGEVLGLLGSCGSGT